MHPIVQTYRNHIWCSPSKSRDGGIFFQDPKIIKYIEFSTSSKIYLNKSCLEYFDFKHITVLTIHVANSSIFPHRLTIKHQFHFIRIILWSIDFFAVESEDGVCRHSLCDLHPRLFTVRTPDHKLDRIFRPCRGAVVVGAGGILGVRVWRFDDKGCEAGV